MAVDKKISQLASGAPAQAGDEYVVARSGANYKLTLTNIAASMPATTITSGNLTFSSTAQRITGDMSNATHANRLSFQTNVTNGATTPFIIPNGTGTFAGIVVANASDPTNSSFGQLTIAGTSDVRLISSNLGTGTLLPMTFYTGGSERVRIDTSGQVGIGATPSAWTATFKVLQISSSSLYNNNANATFVGSNYFFDGTNNKYINSATASAYAQNGGEHIWYNAASGTAGNNVTFTERMRIDSSGGVNIGSSANYGGLLSVNRAQSAGIADLLTLRDASAGTTFNLQTYGDPTFGTANRFNWDGAYLAFRRSGVENLRIDSSGNVGIGSAPGVKFQITQDQAAYSYFDYYNVTNGGGIVWRQIVRNIANSGTTTIDLAKLIGGGFAINNNDTNAANFTAFGVGGTERMRISSSGNVGIGLAPAAGVRLHCRGSDTTSSNFAFSAEDSGGNALMYLRNDGLVNTGTRTNSPYNNTTGSAANVFVDSGGTLQRSTSSLRYKSDVTDATHGLADVLKLRSVTYKAKNDGDTVFGGLIAEEVHEAGLTEFVAYDKEGRPDAIHYGNMVALLVKAVQELTARVAELEAK